MSPIVRLTSAAIALACACSAHAQDASPVPARSTGYSYVDFGPTRYAIPDAYAPGITPYHAMGGQDGKGYAAFTLNVLLPDLQPSGADHEDMKGKGWGRHLVALFEYGLRLRDATELYEETLRWGKIDKADYVTESNGCHVYHGNMTITQEMHVCNIPHSLLVYTCRLKSQVPSPSCHVHEQLDDYTTVIYDYSRDYSENAVKIDTDLRNLVQSFKSLTGNVK